MKTQALYSKIALVIVMAIFGWGCAKKGSDSSVAEVNTGGGVQPAPTPTTPIGGNVVTWQPVSLAEMNSFVMLHPLNAPYNYRLTVDLQDIGSGRYAGSVKVGYYDNGQYFEGVFESGSGYNQVSYHNLDVGKSEAEFNQWFMYGGKRVFHGFFQDAYGAVMLVIDDGIDLGDGGGLTMVSGSIWYKNFTTSYAYQSPEKCWFIRIGPYDCRTFVGPGDVINTTSALYPGNGYRKLGTFTGLDKPRAFNQ